VLCIALSFLFIYKSNKYEYVPATVFAGFTLFFSYHAYRFSKEKFRLDLFDRRFEIYKEIIEFCSIVSVQATLSANDNNREEIKKAHQAAHASFRGMGYHKTHALFGEDIHELCKKLNNSYSHVVSLTESPSDPQMRAQWAQDRMQHIGFISDMTKQLPILFRPYIYFGNYKE
jgi:hypothetical protein